MMAPPDWCRGDKMPRKPALGGLFGGLWVGGRGRIAIETRCRASESQQQALWCKFATRKQASKTKADGKGGTRGTGRQIRGGNDVLRFDVIGGFAESERVPFWIRLWRGGPTPLALAWSATASARIFLS